MPLEPDALRSRRSAPGFVRYDLFLAAALLLLVAAVVVPRILQGHWKAAGFGLLGLGAILAGIVAVLVAVTWVAQGAGRMARMAGHLARFTLCGVLGAAVVTALVANHQAGPRMQDLASAGAALVSGAGGHLLYLKLGPERFWQGFLGLGLALVGALFGGILGLLGPEPWGVDVGILVPLMVYLLLTLRRPSRPEVKP